MAIQGFVSERELIRLLDSRHFADLQTLDYQILAPLEFGYGVEQIGAGCSVAPATIRRHIARMVQGVFDFLELDGSERLLRHWSRRHGACCTWHAQEMIRNAQIFGV